MKVGDISSIKTIRRKFIQGILFWVEASFGRTRGIFYFILFLLKLSPYLFLHWFFFSEYYNEPSGSIFLCDKTVKNPYFKPWLGNNPKFCFKLIEINRASRLSATCMLNHMNHWGLHIEVNLFDYLWMHVLQFCSIYFIHDVENKKSIAIS